MKWSEMRRIAESHGWYLWRNGANHDIYRHPEKKGIMQIARHGSDEIRVGTFNKLKKQIGF
jgi:predicted RNA binding protein YcfA (HicA-like mRNA interferase family)